MCSGTDDPPLVAAQQGAVVDDDDTQNVRQPHASDAVGVSKGYDIGT